LCQFGSDLIVFGVVFRDPEVDETRIRRDTRTLDKCVQLALPPSQRMNLLQAVHQLAQRQARIGKRTKARVIPSTSGRYSLCQSSSIRPMRCSRSRRPHGRPHGLA